MTSEATSGAVTAPAAPAPVATGRTPAGDRARPDVVVVGGGLIGLSCAWRLARAGADVTVVDETPGSGASNVAAGMLAPVTEVAYGEQEQLRLTIAGARRWPSFARELEAAAGEDVGYVAEGTILVGADADDLAVLRDLHAFQGELGLQVEWLASRACRRREPLLSPRVAGGLWAGEDHHVDPRRVVAALRTAAEAAGVRMITDLVTGLAMDGTGGEVAVCGVELRDAGRLDAAEVVLAAGSWSAQLATDLPGVRVPVRPVKGELLVLGPRRGAEVPRSTVRGLVRGRTVYLVPRPDGRLVVGATQEEQGHDTTVTAGGVRRLLDDAVTIVPGIDELELTETIAGSRPGTPDNRPLIGRTDLRGLVLATGHHRNGVLLAPITADAVTATITGGAPDDVVAVADPRRAAITGERGPATVASPDAPAAGGRAPARNGGMT